MKTLEELKASLYKFQKECIYGDKYCDIEQLILGNTKQNSKIQLKLLNCYNKNNTPVVVIKDSVFYFESPYINSIPQYVYNWIYKTLKKYSLNYLHDLEGLK